MPRLVRPVAAVLLAACLSRSQSVVMSMLVGATLSGCALLRGAPEERAITVDLSVSRSEAVRRTLAAFREEGYVVRSTLTSGLNPETEPFRQGDVHAVFRAAVTGTSGSSRVVFSGTYHRERLGGILEEGEHEVRNSDDPTERALWNRLEQLRLAIEQPGP
jgi:hypothetical protein